MPGMGRFGVVSLWGWGCLEVRGLDKVGMRFSSVWLIGQVLYGGGERLRLHIPVVSVVMLESRLASCVHCTYHTYRCTVWSRLLDCFVKLGVRGMGQRPVV